MWATVQLREQIFTSSQLVWLERQQEQLVWQLLSLALLSLLELVLVERLQILQKRMLRLLIMLSWYFLSKVKICTFLRCCIFNASAVCWVDFFGKTTRFFGLPLLRPNIRRGSRLPAVPDRCCLK
jgi:DMSO reductase anchor subunit